MRRPEPGARPIRRALRILPDEPERKGPTIRGRRQDLVHDAVREETNEPISSRSDVDAFSLRVVAVHVDSKLAAGVPPGLLQVVNARDPPLVAWATTVGARVVHVARVATRGHLYLSLIHI